MPIYEGKDYSYEDLDKLRKWNVCAECNGFLALFRDAEGTFLACHEWPRSHHEGIIREASPFEQTGIESLNFEARRKIMVEQHGEEKTAALQKYMGVVSLTRVEAKEILTKVYPDAPDTEIARAMILCANFGLNPLMGHVFLIPFKKRDRDGKVAGESWATVIGIKATRLLANRKGAISYTDDTPRLMTTEEQKKIYGKVQAGSIVAITKCKDPLTGAEVSGYGKWKTGDKVQGTEKGNSPENMAFIRSERQALDRIRPGEMPEGVEVMDDRYLPKAKAEAEAKEDEKPPVAEAIDAKSRVVEEAKAEAKTEPGAEAKAEGEAETELNPEAPIPNTLADLEETMKLCNWTANDLGHLNMQIKKWGVALYKDLTPDQIAEAIQYMKENPK